MQLCSGDSQTKTLDNPWGSLRVERIPVEDADAFYHMFVKLPERSPFLEELVLGVFDAFFGMCFLMVSWLLKVEGEGWYIYIYIYIYGHPPPKDPTYLIYIYIYL